MNTPTDITPAQARMAVHAYQVRHVTDTVTRFNPGTAAYGQRLASYYAEAMRQIADAHAHDCTAAGECGTCEAIRVGLTGVAADLLASRRLARIANHLKEQL